VLYRWLSSIVIIPVTLLVVIPGILLYTFSETRWAHFVANPSGLAFWLAGLLFAAGFPLAVWSAGSFFRFGNGTPAPWDPPKKFVVKGPYLYVRNPMVTGAFLMLFAESIFFQSLPLATWAIFVTLAAGIYIVSTEEKALEERFGDEYRTYKRNVPRWIPRTTPWIR